MNSRLHSLIAGCLLAVIVFCGAFAAVGCDCHDDGCETETAACACDCICCGLAGSPIQVADSNSATVSPLLFASFLRPAADEDSGRLTESFIFTPPRV